MSTQSPYAIQFTPVGGSMIELVSIDGWLVSLPRFLVSQTVFELDGIRNNNGHFDALGGAVVSIAFESERDETSIHDSFLEAEIAGAGNLLQVDGTLVFGGPDGVIVYPYAVITQLSPGLPFGPDQIVTRSFSIQAALPVFP